MTHSMDVLPRQVTHMAQFGLVERLENTKAWWVCASCYACQVVCPRGIDIARLMEAFRLLTLRKNINYIEPSQVPRETLSEYPQIALVSAFRKLTS